MCYISEFQLYLSDYCLIIPGKCRENTKPVAISFDPLPDSPPVAVLVFRDHLLPRPPNADLIDQEDAFSQRTLDCI